MKKNGKIIAACALQMMLIGMYFTWSIFSASLVSDHGWSYAAANLPYTLFSFSYALGLTPLGFLCEKKGLRFTNALGLALFTAGMLLAAGGFTELTVSLGFGVFYGLGMGGMYTAALCTMLECAPVERRSFYSGLAVGAHGLSALMLSNLMDLLIRRFGVRLSFVGVAVLFFPFLFVCCLLIRDPVREARKNEENTRKEPPVMDGVTLKEAMRSKDFYKIAAIYFFGNAGAGAIMANVANIASLQTSALMLAAFPAVTSACSFMGRIGCGRLGDLIPKKRLLAGVYTVSVLTLLFFRGIHSVPLMFVGLAVMGCCHGSTMAMAPALISDHFGLAHYSTIFGTTITLTCLASSAGGLVVGKLVDASGNYNSSYLLCAAYIGIALLVSATLKKNPRSRQAEKIKRA